MKWKSRLPKQTELLVDAVLRQLVPELERRGFQWVDSLMSLGGDQIDRADAIPMHRRNSSGFDAIQIDFSKKRRPDFSFNFRRWRDDELARRELWLPHFLAKAPLTSASSKHLGFHWFDPFVSEARCEEKVARVVALLDQVDEYFNSGRTGVNMTPSVRIAPRS